MTRQILLTQNACVQRLEGLAVQRFKQPHGENAYKMRKEAWPEAYGLSPKVVSPVSVEAFFWCRRHQKACCTQGFCRVLCLWSQRLQTFQPWGSSRCLAHPSTPRVRTALDPLPDVGLCCQTELPVTEVGSSPPNLRPHTPARASEVPELRA